MTEVRGYRLYVGNKFSGYSVVPDTKYPGIMWRVQNPDGSLSDMVNLSRAKDAARSWARVGGDTKISWQIKPSPVTA